MQHQYDCNQLEIYHTNHHTRYYTSLATNLYPEIKHGNFQNYIQQFLDYLTIEDTMYKVEETKHHTSDFDILGLILVFKKHFKILKNTSGQ